MQVTVKTMVEVQCSADDWGLYDKPEREDVAWMLNKAFEDYVKRGYSYSDVEHYMLKKMEAFASEGAADTEPRTVLSYLLSQVF